MMNIIQTLLFFAFVILMSCIVFPGEVAAQQLVYRPVSPTFGGNALNYQGLISIANAQNGFRDPNSVDPFDRDPLQDFNESLERQILNQISRDLISGQLGENFLSEGGTTQVGNFQINVTEGLEGISVLLTDLSTGGTTQLSIPFF